MQTVNSEADELLLISTLIGMVLSEGLTLDEIAIIGNIVSTIGATMIFIATIRAIELEAEKVKEDEKENDDIKRQIKELQKQIKELKEKWELENNGK